MAGVRRPYPVRAGGAEGENSRKDHGFTLIELMVAVGIIVFIAVAGFGAYFHTGGHQAHHGLKAAAGELFMNMQKARAGAVKDNKKWAIVFDTTAPNRYHICSDSGDDDWETLANNTIVRTIDLTAYKHGIGFGAGSAAKSATSPPASFPVEFDFVSFTRNLVIFSPRGFPASSGYCYLSNDQNESYAVGAMTSGVIRVKKWDRNAWK